MPLLTCLFIWVLAAAALIGVILQPLRVPGFIWAAAAGMVLVVAGDLPAADAVQALGQSAQVCLFLTGMMLLAETARREGLFEWLAAWAVNHASGSSARLFLLTWLAGVGVTALLSNDATAVVLTPAVLAATRSARAPPAPFLFACAFVANAASFVLPISNPANLVVFAAHPPAVALWVARFAAPSAVSILGACAALWIMERSALARPCAAPAPQPPLSRDARVAFAAVAAAGAALIVVSALGGPIGAATFVVGALTAGGLLLRARAAPGAFMRGVTWSIVPLTAALFVLVAALERTGAAGTLAQLLAAGQQGSGEAMAGAAAALVANLANNLPVGLMASHVLAEAHSAALTTDAVLMGVDLGPNLSVTGSLATILWLAAIRREGLDIGFMRFLKLGAVVMPASLIPALAVRLLLSA